MVYLYIPTFTINNQPNPGKHTSPMDPMGMHETVISFDANVI